MTIARRALSRRMLAAAVIAVVGLAVGVVGGPVPAGGQTDFQGDDCTSTGPGDGSCIIDEPEGNNPETYGTVTYDRTVSGHDDRIVFDIGLEDPDGTEPPTLQEIQICVQPADGREDNPYTPAQANTCAGQSPDRVYVDEDQPIAEPVTIDLDQALGDGFAPGDPIFFAVHMTIDDNGESRTVMGTAPVGAPGPVTRALVVRKEVVDGAGGEQFTFTVACSDYTLSEQNYDGSVRYENGDATLTLGDDEEATFVSIPRGATCTIGEDVPDGTWVTSVDGEPDDDRATSVTLEEDRTVVFTNQAASTPAGNGGTTPTTIGGVTTTTAGRATTTTTSDTEVGGAVAERPAPGQPAEGGAEQPTQVAGAQEERPEALPRTGAATTVAAAVAAGLILAGTGLRTGFSRRRLSRRSPKGTR